MRDPRSRFGRRYVTVKRTFSENEARGSPDVILPPVARRPINAPAVRRGPRGRMTWRSVTRLGGNRGRPNDRRPAMVSSASGIAAPAGRERAAAVGLVVAAAVSPQIGAVIAVGLFDELG